MLSGRQWVRSGVIARNVISHEEGAELKRLYADFAAASERARVILATEGMESPRFFEADKATGLSGDE
jgi:hypothetical protein